MQFFKAALGPIGTNVILLGCPQTKKAVVIDPGLGALSLVKTQASLWEANIELILLTHSHWDHFAGAADLQKDLSVPLAVHGEDAQNVQNPGIDGLPLWIPIEAARVDRVLADGDIIQIGSLLLQVIHTPGHSPGGVCFYVAKEKLLIAGDTLFRGGIGNLSFSTGDRNRMKTSLDKLRLFPSDTRVVPGHGEETTIGEEFTP